MSENKTELDDAAGALAKTLGADIELVQHVTNLLEACVKEARKRGLPPEIVIASALSMCATSVRRHSMSREILIGASMFCEVREDMARDGVMTTITVSETREPGKES
jgi:hypothetical protein